MTNEHLSLVENKNIISLENDKTCVIRVGLLYLLITPNNIF